MLFLGGSPVLTGLANDVTCMVAQKGHTCKLKMLLQIKNSTCKLKIVHAN